jgi:hypothetical protein
MLNLERVTETATAPAVASRVLFGLGVAGASVMAWMMAKQKRTASLTIRARV